MKKDKKEFPRMMMVSDEPIDENNKGHKRSVVALTLNYAIATIEGRIYLMPWKYHKEIDELKQTKLPKLRLMRNKLSLFFQFSCFFCKVK